MLNSSRTKYQGKYISVGRNHEDIERPHNAILIAVGNYDLIRTATFHPDEARTIAAALIEAADEFDAAVEEAKPNGEDFVNALPIGARFRWEGQFDDQYWIKTGKDEIYLHSSRGLSTAQTLRAENFKFDNNLYVVED